MPGPDRTQLILYAAAALLIAWVGISSLDGCGDDGSGAGAGAELTGAESGLAGAGGRQTAERSGAAEGSAELEVSESSGEIVVHVAGEVRRPGLLTLPDGARVGEAIEEAGGETGRAELDGLNLAMRLADGQQVLVPRRGQAVGVSGAAGGAVAAGGELGASDPGSAAAQAPISLLSATSEQLQMIDGIGPVTAENILEFRDEKGGIGSIEELDEVHGIGPATMEVLRESLVP